MRRVVLFGGGGFIGSHLLARLSDREVIAPAHNAVDLLSVVDIQRTLRQGDVVINAAGYAQATDRSPEGLIKLQASNVDAVTNLARVGAQVGIRQLIHISSVAAMGRVTGQGRNEEATGPINSPYAASKREAEAVLAELQTAMPITILRPTSVFGERRGLAATLCRLARLPVVPLPAGGRAKIPFTYVKNVADAVALSVDNDAVMHETFVVGDEDSYPLSEIVIELAHRLGSDPRIITLPAVAGIIVAGIQQFVPSRAVRQLIERARLETLTTSVSYSIRKFQQATGYVPRHSLADALQALADWYVATTGASHVHR